MKIKSILKPFIERKPWAAAFIALLDPFSCFLYLNKGLIAFGYFLLGILLFATSYCFPDYTLIKILPFSVRILAIIHSFILAKNGNIGKLKWYSHWYSVVSFFIIPVLIAIILKTFFYESFYAASPSMSPAINKSEYFFADKRAYNSINHPARGDVVVFNSQQPSVKYIKRIIAMPSDVIHFKDCAIYINNAQLPERQIENFSDNGKEMAQFIEILPEGKEIKILKEKSKNDCSFTNTYTVPAGNYFVLADNRDNSDDSRYKLGYIPENNILGKVSVVYWFGSSKKLEYRHID